MNVFAESSSTIRKIKTSLDNLFLEQQKIEKGDKPKKKTGAKVKAKIRMEVDVSIFKITAVEALPSSFSSRTITTRELELSKLTITMNSCKPTVA